MAKPSQLDERIRQIRAEIDALIDRHAAEIAKNCPGVPLGVIRQTVIGNEPCQCTAFEVLSEKGIL
jgi:hypothetical protein